LITLTLAASLNDDKCLVMEDAVQFCATDSSQPNTATVIYFESGATLLVKETLEEVRDAIYRETTRPVSS
jgi:hypothetical protein